MNNPILSKLAQGMPQNLGRIKQMMSMMQGAKNPQAMMSQLASQNPQIKTILDMVQGRDPKQVFINACKQKGVDPENIISMLK